MSHPQKIRLKGLWMWHSKAISSWSLKICTTITYGSEEKTSQVQDRFTHGGFPTNL